MQPQRAASLIGLGFGDCGKGLFTDYLARAWNAHGSVAVVRWNGGAQAGHNVVLPDGRHHTFSQFSAGTFVPGVVSILASPVVVHPTALLVEERALHHAGVHDAFARLAIDARCRVTTPFHQAAGRLRELLRGAAAHGTCGVGVGETVRHTLEHANESLLYGDLTNPKRSLEKLDAIRLRLLREFEHVAAQLVQSPDTTGSALQAEWDVLCHANIAQAWFARAQVLAEKVPPASRAALGGLLQANSSVIFEGAQGVLLDEWHGFHPHTSWSTIHPSAVQAVANDLGLGAPVRHYGVLRSYLTRHGAGPLPTEDAALDTLAEPHNHADGWQGRLRRGHPDAVLLRYVREVVGQLDGLCVSHLDVFDHTHGLRWCEAYDTGDAAPLTHLPVSADHDLRKQAALTRSLLRAAPHYEANRLASAANLLEHMARVLQAPIAAQSKGNHHQHVTAQPALQF